jgi:hypothetical protein
MELPVVSIVLLRPAGAAAAAEDELQRRGAPSRCTPDELTSSERSAAREAGGAAAAAAAVVISEALGAAGCQGAAIRAGADSAGPDASATEFGRLSSVSVPPAPGDLWPSSTLTGEREGSRKAGNLASETLLLLLLPCGAGPGMKNESAAGADAEGTAPGRSGLPAAPPLEGPEATLRFGAFT